jgi:putative SOS response-associated peptidase YedK
MQSFFEPCYESGKAVRHQIGLSSGAAFAVAGLWRHWQIDGQQRHAFTQITINADTHPVMRRMHKPDDEKRSLVLIPESQYDAWLDCKRPHHAMQFLRHFGELTATALPRFDPQTLLL